MRQFEEPCRTVQECFTRHARYIPDKLALVCGEERLSWLQLNEGMVKVANGLTAIGIKKGDRVCFLMPIMTKTVEIMYGITKAGAAMVPLSGMVQPETLALIINDCDAQAIFVGPGMDALIEPIRAQINIPEKNFIAVGFEKEGWLPFESFLSGVSSIEKWIKADFDDPWLILYTSGTTGEPKGSLFTAHGRYLWTLNCAIGYHFNETSSTLISTSLYTAASQLVMQPTLLAGGTVILLAQFDVAEWMKLAERERPTHTLLVPTQYYMLLAHPDIDKYDMSHFQVMTSVGAPLLPDSKKEIIKRFGPVFMEMYGLSEGVSTILAPEDVLRKPSSVGIPPAGQEIRIIDNQGNECPNGEVGEIVGYGPEMLHCYYNKPEINAESIWVDEIGRTFLRTGDVGKLDEENYLYILDRKKDMIISGGSNIYAADIEVIIFKHPEVADCAVIGVPSDKWGESPRALVVLKEGCSSSEQEMREWINERVAKYQRVDAVEIRPVLPRNPLGKMLKRQLREPYWEKVGLKK